MNGLNGKKLERKKYRDFDLYPNFTLTRVGLTRGMIFMHFPHTGIDLDSVV